MLSHYKILTTNHSLISTEDLGGFILSDAQNRPDFLKNLMAAFNIRELLYLATCNRVIYLFTTPEIANSEFVTRFFNYIQPNTTDRDDLEEKIAVFEGLEAVRHMLEVSGSVDSLVVGEREIFRQYREAYASAVKFGISSDNLRLLDKKLVETAKKIYTQTKIGEKPLSIVSLACTQLREVQPVLSPRKVAFIGAGQTNQKLAGLLPAHPDNSYAVYNRTEANASALVNKLGAAYFPLESLETMKDFDLVCLATGAREPLLRASHIQRLPERQRVVIDLSIPSNVDESVKSMKNISYIGIESLKELAAYNLKHRKNEVVLAKQLIETAVEEFNKTYLGRKIERALSDVPADIRKIKDKAIEEIFQHRIAQTSQEARELIYEMMDYMEKKCVAVPIKTAKKKLV